MPLPEVPETPQRFWRDPVRQGSKGRVNFADRIGVEGQLDLKPHGGGGFLHIPQRGLGDPSVCRIQEHGNTNGLRHQVMK